MMQVPVRDLSQLLTEGDVNDVVEYMQILRGIGIAPSDVVRKGIDYSELYVKQNNSDKPQLIQMKLSAILCEKAAIVAEVHAGTKRKTTADMKKAALEKAK